MVIPNFLPDDEFARVVAEYRKSEKDPARRFVSFGDNVGAHELFISDYLDQYPDTARALRNNEFLLDLASAISRRRRSYKPHVSFFTVGKTDPAAPHVDHDYNQFAHADRHYAFIKAFFYLTDVDEDTAPFSYAVGTHRLSSARVRYEYDYSREYCRVRGRGRYVHSAQSLLANQRLRDCGERLMEITGRPCAPIVGKANTLIVANNQGFHKRGELRSSQPRITVNIDFKYLESVGHTLYPVLNTSTATRDRIARAGSGRLNEDRPTRIVAQRYCPRVLGGAPLDDAREALDQVWILEHRKQVEGAGLGRQVVSSDQAADFVRGCLHALVVDKKVVCAFEAFRRTAPGKKS